MDMKRNYDVRNAIEEAELRYWQVADAFGMHEGNFSRLLRKELDDDTKIRLLAIIGKLKKGGVSWRISELTMPSRPAVNYIGTSNFDKGGY